MSKHVNPTNDPFDRRLSRREVIVRGLGAALLGTVASGIDANIAVRAEGVHPHVEHTWYGWESLGGTLTSGPAAASWSANRLDVFVRGTDNAMYHKWWDGIWYDWENLGGENTSGPAAASWGSDHLDIFAMGTDSALWHRGFDRGWHDWGSLGGIFTSDPAAVSWGPNRIDTFIRGTDNATYHKWWIG